VYVCVFIDTKQFFSLLIYRFISTKDVNNELRVRDQGNV
jgi:hypothetical protein